MSDRKRNHSRLTKVRLVLEAMMETDYSLVKVWPRTQSNQGILFHYRRPNHFLLHELRFVQNLQGIVLIIAFVNSIDDLSDHSSVKVKEQGSKWLCIPLPMIPRQVHPQVQSCRVLVELALSPA